MSKQNPHICHVTVGHNPTDDRIFYKECVSLAKKYNQITLIAPNRENISSKKNHITFKLFEESTFFKNLKKVYKLAKEVNADIYHIHEFELLPYFLWLKFIRKKTIIYDAHESIFNFFMEFSKRPKYIIWPVALLAQTIEWVGSAFVDQVITVTPWVADGFKPFNQNIELIYNFPQVSHFDTPVIAKTKNPMILYAGHISNSRNIEVIIEAMKYVIPKYPNSKLCLVGNISDDYKMLLNSLINEYDFVENIEIKEPVPYIEIPPLMKSAHIGLSSMMISNNLKKAIQVKDLEYMYCKVPVITAKVPSTEMLIQKNNAGIVLEEISAKSVADAMIKILSNPDLSCEMGENGHKAVINKYNWQEMENKLLDRYNEVINR